jgi:hypothetical protein
MHDGSDLDLVPTSELIDELKHRQTNLHGGMIVALWHPLDNDTEQIGVWYNGPSTILRGLLDHADEKIRTQKLENRYGDDSSS